jgi:hypothetical protein
LKFKLGYRTGVRFVDFGETHTTWRNVVMKGRCRKSRIGKFEKNNRGIGKL